VTKTECVPLWDGLDANYVTKTSAGEYCSNGVSVKEELDDPDDKNVTII
jgi:hypothetical protein